MLQVVWKQELEKVYKLLQLWNFQSIITYKGENKQYCGEISDGGMGAVGRWNRHSVKTSIFRWKIVTNYSIVIVNMEAGKSETFFKQIVKRSQNDWLIWGSTSTKAVGFLGEGDLFRPNGQTFAPPHSFPVHSPPRVPIFLNTLYTCGNFQSKSSE